MAHPLPEVRIATPDDEADILAMCRRLHSENGLFSLNENKVQACLRHCYARIDTNEARVIVGVIGPVGSIQASTCLSISDFYYTDEWHLAELWNFVDAEHRVSRNAEALIEFGKACAEKMGVPFFTGIITNRQMAGKVRLYRRLLGHPAGAFFIYNAAWKSEPMEDHSELRNRLKESAVLCNNGKVTFTMARKQVGPLLREAADALSGEDNLWGAPKLNGARAGTG